MSVIVEMTMNNTLTDITEDVKVSGCLLRYVNGSPDYKFAPDLFDFTIRGSANLLIGYLVTKYRRERVVVYNEDKTEVYFEGFTEPYNDTSFRDDYGDISLSAKDRISVILDHPCDGLSYREQTLKHIAEDICGRVSLGFEFPAQLGDITIPFFARDFNEERYLALLDTLLWEYGYTLYNRHALPSIAAVRKWFHDIPSDSDLASTDRYINADSNTSIKILEPFEITEEELEHQIVAVEAKQLKKYVIDPDDTETTGTRLYLENSEDPTKNPVTAFNGPGVYPIDAEVKLTYQRYNLARSGGERFDNESRLLHAWDQVLNYRYLVGNTTHDEVIAKPWPYSPPYMSPGGVTPEVVEHYNKRSRVVLKSTRSPAPNQDTVFQEITLYRTTDGNFRRRWIARDREYLDKIIVGRAGDTYLISIEIGASGDIYIYFGGTLPGFAKNETHVRVAANDKDVYFRLSSGNPYTQDNFRTRAIYREDTREITIRFTPRYETATADKLAKLAFLEIRGSAFVQHGILKIRDGVDSVSERFDAVSVASSAGRTSYALPAPTYDPDSGELVTHGGSSEDDYYNNWRLISEFGTNLLIRDYIGSTRTAIVEGIVQESDTAGTRLSLISPTLGVTEEEVRTQNIFSKDYKLEEGEELTFNEIYEDAFNLGEGYRNLREYGRYLFKCSLLVNDRLPKIGEIYKLVYQKYGLITTVVVHQLEYLPDDPDNPTARIIFKKIGNFDPSRAYIESASIPSITEPEPIPNKEYVPNVPVLSVKVENNNAISSWNSQPGLQNLSHHELQITNDVAGDWFAPDFTDSRDWKRGEVNSYLNIYGFEFVQVNFPYNSTFFYRVRRSMVDDSKSDWSDPVQFDIGDQPTIAAGGVLLDEVIYAESDNGSLTNSQLPDNDWAFERYGTVGGVTWSGDVPSR